MPHASKFATLCAMAFVHAFPSATHGFTRELAPLSGDRATSQSLAADCTLADYNFCSMWAWIFDDAPGAVWGAVFDPDDCAGGCWNGGAVSEVTFYSRCTAIPATIGGVRIVSLDEQFCPDTLLYDTGPIELTHCVLGDRWTTVPIDANDTRLGGDPFAVQLVWGDTTRIRFASDNALANLYCSLQHTGTFPGCYSTVPTCGGFTLTPNPGVSSS